MAQDAFNHLMAELDYSMLVVTTASEQERAGCLVGFATQVSIRPARFLVCLSDKNRTFRVAQRSQLLAVHFVPAQAPDLAELFGGQTGDDVDKFTRAEWQPGPGGVPILSALENWFAGRILDRLPFGDHWGFVLEPVAGHIGPDEGPFNFHRARRIAPGHPA